jgi:signal transduction histidine kinase
MNDTASDIALSLGASASFLAIAVLAFLRRNDPLAKSVAWPFVLLCLDLFAYNLFQALADQSLHDASTWRSLNAAAASLATPFFYHLVVAFVGARRRLGKWLLVTYIYFAGLTLACLAPLFEAGSQFPGGSLWAQLLLAGEVPILIHSMTLLFNNLKGAPSAERARTRLVMAAGLIAGISTVAELTSIAGAPSTPRLSVWGLLISALVLGAAALRVLKGLTVLTWLLALAIGLSLVLAQVAVFGLLGERIALAAAITLLAGMLAVAAVGFGVGDYVSIRERTLAHATLGRLSEQMAHDIKNPLASLRGAAQFLITERSMGRSIDSQGEFLSLIDEQCSRMARLIEQYQRVGRAEAVFRPIQLNDAVMESTQFLKPTSVRVELESDLPSCRGDRDLLVIAFENVLKNAHEAAPEKPVQIRSGRTTLKDADGVFVEVRDEGPGMDARTKERALGGFFTTKANGSGLGLAFVRRVVEAHQGRLNIESHEGLGTTVRIDLPL